MSDPIERPNFDDIHRQMEELFAERAGNDILHWKHRALEAERQLVEALARANVKIERLRAQIAAKDAALTGNPEYDMAAKYIANHEAAAAHTNKILDEALRQIDEIVKERDYLDRRCVDHEAALRNIAEGNLGDEPWQANYARIKEVARAALTQPPQAQEDKP